ncbi:MAG: hypothetical protein FWC00_01735 [Firmicutes bacterium]|nr:hypothetical protein [Bacillota bacterium]
MNQSDLKKIIEQYNKLSDEELIFEFAKYAAEQEQKDGGESMRKTIARLKPFLNKEQREKLDAVLQGTK